MRLHRLTALVVALLIVAASPARADTSPGGDGGAFIDDGDPTAIANEDDEATPGAGGGGSQDDCVWKTVVWDDFKFAMYDPNGNRLYSKTGRWVQLLCNGTAQRVNGSYLVPQGGPVDPRALAVEALASAPISVPPMATSPSDDRLYTQVRTWLWVDEAWWQTYTATANAGRVSSTVTAVPVRAEWDAGDGGGTTCNGPGVAWQRGMRDDATYCSYVYRRSSAGEDGATYTLAVAVIFEVSWTSNTGQAGSLAPITRAASRQVEVGEVQALETE